MAILDNRFWFQATKFLAVLIRMLYNVLLLGVIPYYVMTVDAEGAEGGLDLVTNFTALYIMCDIDQLLAMDGNTI